MSNILEAAPEPTGIEIKLGTYQRRYMLYETNAPPRYDHHGTLTIYGGEGYDSRFVLIPDGAVAAQVARNSTGLYQTVPCDALSGNDLQDKLYELLLTLYEGGK